jgi:hypothetical protein
VCKDSDLEDTGHRCRINSNWPTLIEAGSLKQCYVMQPWVFHESVPLGPAITVMTKMPARDHQMASRWMTPRVLVGRGKPYDHEFMRRKWDGLGEQHMLWCIVAAIWQA